jgi:Mn-dependent DtxR family transcriptional regulator
MSKNSTHVPVPALPWTDLQGQYLAFIQAYTKVNRRPPAEVDMQRFFEVTPPSVHRMVRELEAKGFIRRTPRTARSIELLVSPDDLPVLR